MHLRDMVFERDLRISVEILFCIFFEVTQYGLGLE